MTSIDLNEHFNDSFEFINRNSPEFYRCFYENFTSSSAAVRHAFRNTNMTAQIAMLHEAVVDLVNFFVTKVADAYLIKLGKLHANLLPRGEDLFATFVDSLIDTVRAFYPKFKPETEIAWRITLAPGIELLKHSGKIS